MLFRRPNYFPKQLFFRFLTQQILGMVPVLIVATVAARIYLSKNITSLESVQDAVRSFDHAFFSLALVMAATVTTISLWTAYKMILPLGRILVKARSIQSRDYSSADREEESGTTEFEAGEWSDLENTLHHIGRDMETQDISLSRERGETEAIISAISEAVVAVDPLGNLLFFNSQFAVMFGNRDQQKRTGRLSDFFRSPDVLEAFRSTLKTGAPLTISMHLQLKGEHAPRYFSLSIAPLNQVNGQLYGAVGVFHDVTDLKHMDQVRIDFVANVSHELRSPLTSIKGYAQTLKEELQSESSKKYLDTIERNTNRLIALVQDLLNLSSLESGAALESNEVNLKDLTDRVLSQLDTIRVEKGHRVRTQIEVPSLWADPKRIEQVLFNLLENAFKYASPGGEVTVTWTMVSGEVQLHVRDSGPGIPVEHHTRIFERFYRVDSARNREQGGTGLGLAIVKHIVQRHGGRIRVQGGPGEGTVFVCTFPAEKK